MKLSSISLEKFVFLPFIFAMVTGQLELYNLDWFPCWLAVESDNNQHMEYKMMYYHIPLSQLWISRTCWCVTHMISNLTFKIKIYESTQTLAALTDPITAVPLLSTVVMLGRHSAMNLLPVPEGHANSGDWSLTTAFPLIQSSHTEKIKSHHLRIME